MTIVEIITKKKQGLELTKEEIFYFIEGYTTNEIKDYQASSLLMAICLKGLLDNEIVLLTEAMVASGETIDLESITKITVDKHSTGGVGDKTTIFLAPILACFDLAVAKMSGRGLGHTGGTIDKLESINGFNVELTEEKFLENVNDIGIAIIGQTKNLVPADKLLYALRDVTATIDSVGLIASSIMSKKIASGASNIFLDVKYGDGAFMKTQEEAKTLAKTLVMIGKNMGRNTSAIVTSMVQPLGTMVGNALEVKEAIEVLKGKGSEDLKEIMYAFMCEILVKEQIAPNNDIAMKMVNWKINSGQVYKKFEEFVIAQGANTDALENLVVSEDIVDIRAKKTGYISSLKANLVGESAVELGAGRKTIEDTIDYSVGIELISKVGDKVSEGQIIAKLYVGSSSNVIEAIRKFEEAIVVEAVKPEKIELISCLI